MARKAFICQKTLLATAKDNNSIVSYTTDDEQPSITVSFKGPANTKYGDCVYTIRFTMTPDYPFKPLHGFWIGQAPQHRFYDFDLDDEGRAKRTTNLAHTDFGIWYQTYSPRLTIEDYVKRIQYSLTPAGEAAMQSFMQASNPL